MSNDRWLTRFPFRGKGICSWCGGPVKPPRIHWCGDACVREWKVRSNATDARRFVRERDHGVCALCSFDAIAAERELDAAMVRDAERNGGLCLPRGSCVSRSWLTQDRWRDRFPEFHAVADALGVPMRRRNTQSSALWEADHTVPVMEGGGCCGLEGLRTLCWSCHAKETAKLAHRRAARRSGWTQALSDSLVDDVPA